ncbi:hypothetical protein COF68_05540 [Bacillus toyonensis]|uniref:hypothetical protein n=1 Tax=Bacillus toyonensis TaxID=155322 RepID=UPI000BFCB940|nr:hypothetical protein [Bacillus toyonensis]PHE64306.1 hypothetical protein COF68_05540 [Bacillus toyonensis]
MTKVFRTLKKVTGIEKLNDKLEEKLTQDHEAYNMRRRVNPLTKLQTGEYDLVVTEDGEFIASPKVTETIKPDGILEVEFFRPEYDMLFVYRQHAEGYEPKAFLSTTCSEDRQLASFEELKKDERRFLEEGTRNYLILRDGIYLYKQDAENGKWLKVIVK